MRLYKIQIENYRSFKDSGPIMIFDYSSFIGPNNAGKSNILSAINVLLSTGKVGEDDWHNGQFQEPIKITGWFDNLKDWEKLRPALSPLVFEDQIRIQYKATWDKDQKKPINQYLNYYAVDTIASLGKSLNELNWTELPAEIKEIASGINVGGKPIDGRSWRNTASKTELLQALKRDYPHFVAEGQAEWVEKVNFFNTLKQGMPNVISIPAVRDAEDEAKSGANTAMGKILGRIIMPIIRRSKEYSEIENAIKNLRVSMEAGGLASNNRLQKLKESLSDRLRQMINLEVSLNVTEFDFVKDLGSKFGLTVKDGSQETRVGLQGHGAQRTLLFSLLEQLGTMEDELEVGEVDQEGEARSTILLFEEPELFIHPHLLRKLQKILKLISNKQDWQVCITTHSPVLVEVGSYPQALILVRKHTSNSEVVQLNRDIFEGVQYQNLRSRFRATLDFHPTVCEVFFAKEVVLVEGDTELAIFSKAEEFCKLVGLDAELHKEVTIVSCKGKWTIIPFAKILNEFKIPYRVVHDQDYKKNEIELDLGEISTDLFWDSELQVKSPNRLLSQKNLVKANDEILKTVGDKDRIFIAAKSIEHLLWPGRRKISNVDKPFKAYNQMLEILEEMKNSTMGASSNPDNPFALSEEISAKYSELIRLFRFVYG